MSNVGITKIEQLGDRKLEIGWSDGVTSVFDVVTLRRNCPCALCVDEWTQKRTLKPQDISENIRPKTIESVGRYALKVNFSDSHSTGIFTYELLRRLASQKELS